MEIDSMSAEFRPNWPDAAKPFVRPYTGKEFGTLIFLNIPKDERVIGGLTKGSFGAYTHNGKLIADWSKPYKKDGIVTRWEAVYDNLGRIVAKRMVDSTFGNFDGVTGAIYAYKYNTRGDKRKCTTFVETPERHDTYESDWSSAKELIDGKYVWTVDEHYTPPEIKELQNKKGSVFMRLISKIFQRHET